jgi:hypothetical protein
LATDRWHTGAVRLVVCLACFAALAVPTGVLADGDPASDYLIGADAYLPYPPPAAAARAELSAALGAVRKQRGRVKVAVIATPSDLGAIPSLFGRPADYAKFLGLEIEYSYNAALLVVMPAGYGFYEGGRATPAADATLGALPAPDKSPDGLTRAAAQAVTALGRAGALVFTDTKKPSALPLVESARAGRPVKLRYQAADDSGRAAVVLTVFDGSRRIALFKRPEGALLLGAIYSVTWHVPVAAAHRSLAYCARATDPSGNRSPLTCAKLTVR